jgi:putative PEP-CTERM system TPR-repeat lipoprotein
MPFCCRLKQLVRLLGAVTLLLTVHVTLADSADEYFAEAERYLKDGETRAAMIELKNALQQDPTHVQARLMLGELHLQRADGAAAAKEYRRARDLGAPSSDWMIGYARALLMQGEFETLLAEIEPASDMPAEMNSMLQALRGNAFLAQGDVAAATAAYDAALVSDAENLTAQLGKAQILLTERRLDDALTRLDAVLATHPDHAQSRLARADIYRGQQRFDEAIQDYEIAAKGAPNDPRVYTGLALVHIATRNMEEANKALTSLRRVGKGLPAINYLQALVSFQEQDFDRAAEELQLLLRAAPGNLQAQMLYGIVSYARNQFTIADDYLTRVHASAPGNLQVIKLLGASRLKLREPARAVAVMAPAVTPETQDAQLLALLGTAYIQSGDNAKGAEMMERAIAIDPDQAMLRTQLAVGKIVSGDTTGAISELESAVALGQDLIQADVLLVISYLKKNEFDKALAASRALEQRLPDSPIPLNLTGLAYLSQRDFAAATERFEAAVEKDPGFMVARMNLARAALMQNQPDAARSAYEDVLEHDPKHVEAMLGIAALARAAADDAETEAWVLRANAADPTAVKPMLLLAEIYLRKSEPLKATNALSGLSPEQAESPAALRLRGMAQLQSGEFARAAATLTKLAEKSPEAIEAWFQLARAQAAAGNSAAARESFQRAIALDAEHKVPVVWIGLGELELRDKRFDEALAVADQVKQHFPWTASGFDIAAAAYRGQGQADKALVELKQGLDIDPTAVRIDGYARALATDSRFEEAVVALRQWLDEHPEDAPRWARLGLLLQQLGRNDEALQAYENATARAEPDAVLANNMAWLYLERNPARAVELATKAYELAPSRAEIVDTYGWVLYKTGREREGLAALQQALIIAPRNPEIALHVSEALLGLRRAAEARPILERIVRDHPRTEYAETANRLLASL